MLRFIKLFLTVNLLVITGLYTVGCSPKDNTFLAEGKGATRSITTKGVRPTASCKKSWGSVRVSDAYYKEADLATLNAVFSLGDYNCNEVGSNVGLELGAFKSGEFDYKSAKKLGRRNIVRIDIMRLSDLTDAHVKLSGLSGRTQLLNMIEATASPKTRDRGMVTVIYIEAGGAAATEKRTFNKVGERPTKSCKKSWSSVRVASGFYQKKDAGKIGAIFSLGDYNCNEVGSAVSLQIGAFQNGEFDFKKATRLGTVKITQIEFMPVVGLDETHAKLAGLSLAKLKEMIEKTKNPKTRNTAMVTVIYIEAAASASTGGKTVTKKGQGVSKCRKEWTSIRLHSSYYDTSSAAAIGASFSLGDFSCHLVGATNALELGAFNNGVFDYQNKTSVGQKVISKIQTMPLADIDSSHAKLAGLSLNKLKDMIKDTANPKVRNTAMVTVIYFDGASISGPTKPKFKPMVFQKVGERPTTCKGSRDWKVLAVSSGHYSQPETDKVTAIFSAGKMNCHRVGDLVQVRLSQFIDGKAQVAGHKRLKYKAKIKKIEIIKLGSLTSTHASAANLTLANLKKMVAETALSFVDKSVVAVVHFDQVR